MLTLSYGYKKPENSDTGDVFYPAMANNMDQLNGHNHDGTSSAPIAAINSSLPSGSWVAVGARPGIYSQLLNISAGFNAYQISLWFFDSNDNSVNLEYAVTSASSITVYTNDSSETYTAYYK